LREVPVPRPLIITEGSQWGAAPSIATDGGTGGGGAHTHTMGNHTHTMGSHTHTSAAHTHSVALNLNYVDLILASKN